MVVKRGDQVNGCRLACTKDFGPSKASCFRPRQHKDQNRVPASGGVYLSVTVLHMHIWPEPIKLPDEKFATACCALENDKEGRPDCSIQRVREVEGWE